MRKSLQNSFLFFLVVAAAGCGPKVEPMKVSGPKNESASFVDQMVAKAQGDPSRLTPEERRKMDEITRGNTEIVIRSGKK